MPEEDHEFWYWKGQMLAAGPPRDRAVAVNMKMNTIRECVDGFRCVMHAILDGYDGMDALREQHRRVQFWMRMTGYWAKGAVDHHRSTGRLSIVQPWKDDRTVDEPEIVPLLNVRWAADVKSGDTASILEA